MKFLNLLILLIVIIIIGVVYILIIGWKKDKEIVIPVPEFNENNYQLPDYTEFQEEYKDCLKC